MNQLGPGAPESSEERLQRFQFLVNRYEINAEFAMRLRALEGYEIVFIVDGKTIARSSCSSRARTSRGSRCLLFRSEIVYNPQGRVHTHRMEIRIS